MNEKKEKLQNLQNKFIEATKDSEIGLKVLRSVNLIKSKILSFILSVILRCTLLKLKLK
jgi:hypothetical protein